MAANFLHRQSTGLTDASREFIRMLAVIAVERYIYELDVQVREDQDERHPPKR